MKNLTDEESTETHMFDFSGYVRDSLFYNNGNKTFIGKMKDELNGKIINTFVGLHAKI